MPGAVKAVERTTRRATRSTARGSAGRSSIGISRGSFTARMLIRAAPDLRSARVVSDLCGSSDAPSQL